MMVTISGNSTLVEFKLPVTDDLDMMYLQPNKKFQSKWYSEDPNVLSGVISELREEMKNKARPETKKSSTMVDKAQSKLQIQDNVIEGPEDYSYSHEGRVVVQPIPEQQNFDPQIHANQHNYYYPYNSMYVNYHNHHPQTYDHYNLAYQGGHTNQHQQNERNYVDNNSWYQQQDYGHFKDHKGQSNNQNFQRQYRDDSRQSRMQPNQYEKNPSKFGNPKSGVVGNNNSKSKFQASQFSPVRTSNHQSWSEQESDEEEKYSSSNDEDYDDYGNSNGRKAGNHSSNDTRNQLKRFKQIIEAKTSHILHIKGLESDEITPDLLNSLFSNFGNIMRLLFVHQKKAAFIVYENKDLATIAKEMLCNLRFVDCYLKVLFFKY